MLRLMLFRHAHADRPADVADHERPLSDDGRQQARVMGNHIGRHGLVPQMAIVSTSRRTRETWTHASESGSFSAPVTEDAQVYEAAAGDLLEVIRGQDAAYANIMLVGHNPGMERLAAWLIGEGETSALGRLQREFVVGGLAVIDFDAASWAEIDVQSGRLEHFDTPDSV